MQAQANPNLNPDTQPRMATGEQRNTPERQLDRPPSQQPERQATSPAEKGSHQPSGLPTQAVTAPQVASVAQPVVSAASATVAPSSLSATDGGKLEKPWVDRADEIIEKTAQDPYAEEEAHEELSALYLKQRFNLDIKRNNPQR